MIDPTHIFLESLAKPTNMLNVYALVQGQWQLQSTFQIQGEPTATFFVNATTGWLDAVQSSNHKVINTLYTTNDGGKTWHVLTQTITNPPLQGG